MITLHTGSLLFSNGLSKRFMGFFLGYLKSQDIQSTNLDPLCISNLEPLYLAPQHSIDREHHL